MARYVDGYVLPVPKKNVAAYRKMAKAAGKIWKEFGALEFRECVGDDLNVPMGMTYQRLLKLKPGETAFFSWIVYKSRADRDRINAKIMKDPRIAAMMPANKKPPFDMKRMVMGGFKVLVEA